MTLSNGFMRPELGGLSSEANHNKALITQFRQTCPGRVVPPAPSSPSHVDDLVIGRSLSTYSASATNNKIRFQGSSGGVITALTTWLLETGQARRIFTVKESDSPHRTTVPVTLTRKEEALASAGSRYCPVATLAGVPRELSSDDVVVGKPCEISALRRQYPITDPASPLLLSFFCAGTPSLEATNRILDKHGIDSNDVLTSLRYRGNGWPGKFTATSAHGVTASMSYDESWGNHLGPTMQWRCKLCANGVGESADIVCADYWESDDKGYPIFDEEDGTSAVVVRTERGASLIQAAFNDKVIAGHSIAPCDLADVQPGQKAKRTHMASRLAGTFIAGKRIPRYRGYRLLEKEGDSPRNFYGNVRATWGRARRLLGGS